MTISDAATAYLNERSPHILPASMRIYTIFLNIFQNWFKANGITELGKVTWQDCEKFENAQMSGERNAGRPWSETTTRFYRTILETFLDWCVREGLIQKNPAQDHRLPKRVKHYPKRETFSEAQYQAALSAAGAHVRYQFIRPMIVVAWNTGCRISDVAQMQWEWVNFDRESINWVPWKTRRRKTKEVEMPMTSELVECLKSIRASGKFSKSHYVFPEANTFYQMSSNPLTEMFRRVFNNARLPNHTFHCLRHSFVSRMLNAGTDPITLSQMMGLSVEQLQTYSHISIDAKRTALHKMEVARKVKPAQLVAA